MGQPSGGGTDAATLHVTGSFVASGQSASILIRGDFNVSVWGTFSASTALERSFDGGTTWLNCSTDASGTANAITTVTSAVCKEPEAGVLYRLNCTWSSGTVNWRISQ